MRPIPIVGVLIFLFPCLPVAAVEAVPDPDFDVLLKQLGADDAAEREKAVDALTPHAERLWERLTEISKGEDLEARARARLVLERAIMRNLPAWNVALEAETRLLSRKYQDYLDQVHRRVLGEARHAPQRELEELSVKISRLCNEVDPLDRLASEHALTEAQAEQRRELKKVIDRLCDERLEWLKRFNAAERAAREKAETLAQELRKAEAAYDRTELNAKTEALDELTHALNAQNAGLKLKVRCPAEWPGGYVKGMLRYIYHAPNLSRGVTFEFVDTPVDEAFAFFNSLAQPRDWKKHPILSEAWRCEDRETKECLSKAAITLKAENLALGEALAKILEAAGCEFRVDPESNRLTIRRLAGKK